MSRNITKNSVDLPDQGLVLIDLTLVLHDASMHQPDNAQAVWLVIDGEDGLYWEFGDYQDGTGLRERGWYLMGIETPLNDDDERVVYWCHEPPLPPRPDNAPTADTGQQAEASA